MDEQDNIRSISEYKRTIQKFKQILNSQLEAINYYKTNLSAEVGLSSEGKGKMRILLENLIGKIEDYLAEYDKECTKIKFQDNPGLLTPKIKRLTEKFEGFQIQFEKLGATTPKLTEIKKKLDEKIKYIESMEIKSSRSGLRSAKYSEAPSELFQKTQLNNTSIPKFESYTYESESFDKKGKTGVNSSTLRGLRKGEREDISELGRLKEAYKAKEKKEEEDGNGLNDKWVNRILEDIEERDNTLAKFEHYTKLRNQTSSTPAPAGKAKSATTRPAKPSKRSANNKHSTLSGVKQKKDLEKEKQYLNMPSPPKSQFQRNYAQIQGSSTAYLQGFKVLSDEFSELKRHLVNLKEESREHRHYDLEKDVEKNNTECIKILSDNTIIHKEFTEVLHTIHGMEKRIQTLERENKQLKIEVGDLTHELRMQGLQKDTQTTPMKVIHTLPVRELKRDSNRNESLLTQSKENVSFYRMKEIEHKFQKDPKAEETMKAALASAKKEEDPAMKTNYSFALLDNKKPHRDLSGLSPWVLDRLQKP